MSFFHELQRRNVIRAGVAYAVVAWLIAQVADLALDTFEAPGWVMKIVLVLMALGLVPVLFVSWAFELTPEGFRKEAEVGNSQSVATRTGRKLNVVIIGALAIGLGYFVWESRLAGDRSGPQRAVAESAVLNHVADEPAAAGERSVAILPFVNMSSDKDKGYFADGITEEIINAVVKIPGVSVPARTSVFGFKDYKGDVRDIGRSLGVAHVLEGSVRSQGSEVRITAKLIRVDNGFHLWSQRFDRELENIFAVQEEIATAIAGQLIGELSGAIETVPNTTRNMAAYDTYLQGRAALRLREQRAIELLESATGAAPDFAPAWAALAIAYQSVADDHSKAIVTAQKALTLDPANVDALDALGSELRDQRRWGEAEAVFDRALAIDPNSAELLEDYAEFLAFVGRTGEALAVTTRGMAIDARLYPLTVAHIEALATNGRVGEASALLQETLEESGPELRAVSWWLSSSIWLDPSSEGLDQLLDVAPAASDGWPEGMARTMSLALRVLEGASDPQTIAELKQSYQPETESAFRARIARDALILAGEIDFVIGTDLAMFEMPDFWIYEWNWTPRVKPVREHPRFAEYLERAGLIDYWDATRWPDWCQRDPAGAITCR